MIIYKCENCLKLFWTKTTLSEHQIKEHLGDGRKVDSLLWRRYDIIVKNKSSLNKGLGINKSIGGRR